MWSVECSDMEIRRKKQGNRKALIPGPMINPIGPMERNLQFMFDGCDSHAQLEPIGTESNGGYCCSISDFYLGDIDTVVHEALQRNKI